MIRSSRHHLHNLNLGKNSSYQEFLNEYSNYAIKVVNHIWDHGYKDFSITQENLKLPKFLDYKDFNFKTRLSARAKSSAVDQASQIIRSCVEKQRRTLWVKEHKGALVKDKKFSKPNLNFVPARLSSKCCDFEFKDGQFLGFVRLKSLGEGFGSIKIPIVKNPRACGEIKAGFLFFKDRIQVAWEKPSSPAKKGSKILAIDQGFKDVATCSDGQTSPKICPQGHSLEAIIEKISRKKKGSKAFEKAVNHRKNFINWSINQLNFQGVKEVRLEKIVNIRYRRNSSRKLSHWSNPEIRDKIKSRCEELEVPVIEQSCAYRSQRCSRCGLVRKANRKGKTYLCKGCGFECDSDYNASLNHLGDLPRIPDSFFGKKKNLGAGFYWLEGGFFYGAERGVPLCLN